MGLLDSLLRRPVSRDAFATRAREAILADGQVPSHVLAFDAANFEFTIHTPREQTVLSLAQLYAEYRAAPAAERDGVFGFIAATVHEQTAPPLTSEAARSRLLFQLRARAQELPPIYEVVAERLAACLCLDSAVSMRFVVPSDLESWDLTVDAAFEAAYANLRARSPTAAFTAVRKGVFRSTWLDTYDAARADLPEVVCELLGAKQPVVTVPNRETLLVADRGDIEAVHALVEETQRQFQQPRSISQRLLTYSETGLVPLEARRDDVLYELIRTQDVLDLAADYVAVQARVRQQHGLELDLPGLASTPTGEAFTFARWQAGVDKLLPNTELVALVGSDADGAQPLGAFPMERLLAILDDLVERANDDYPPMFRTRGFPDAAQRARLGPSLATIGSATARDLRSVPAKRS